MRNESSFSQNRAFIYLENKKKEKYPIFLFVENSFYGRINSMTHYH